MKSQTTRSSGTKFRRRTIGLALFVVVLVALAFQNCGPGMQSKTVAIVSKNDDFFQYPYKSTPIYFHDFLVYKTDDSSGVTITKFSVQAAMRNIQNPDAAVDYTFDIYGTDGVTPLCPRQTGTVAPPVTTLSFDCVSAKPGRVLNVIATLGTGDGQQVMRKTFTN